MSYLHVQWLSAAEVEAMNMKAKQVGLGRPGKPNRKTVQARQPPHLPPPPTPPPQALNRYLSKLDRGDAGTPEVRIPPLPPGPAPGPSCLPLPLSVASLSLPTPAC